MGSVYSIIKKGEYIMNERTIEKLKSIARSNCFYDDDFEYRDINDYAAGNVDDAFILGVNAGEIILARGILRDLSIDWKTE
jgi:hypothetical protein